VEAVRKAQQWHKSADRPNALAEPLRLRLERETIPAAAIEAPVLPRQTLPIGRWFVAALAFVCLVESMIIAGLLASRGQTTSAATVDQAPAAAERSSAPSAPAPAPSSQRAAPQRTAVTPTSRPPTPSQPPAARTQADAKPAASVTAPPPRGWLTIESPLELQVFEGRTLVGTTKAGRLALSSGRHDLRLASAALGFETSISVDIPAGGGHTTRVPVPNGTLSLNALPWANVSLDGQSLGTTPFANLSVPVGTHEVIWRHPQLGERRQSVVLTASSPVRLVVDLRK
jgi:hypothetical protein